MTSPNDPAAPLSKLPDLDAAYVFEAGLNDLEHAFVQLLRGTRDHPDISPAEFAALAAPVLADLRRTPPPSTDSAALPPLPHLRRLDIILAPAPRP